MLFNNFNEFYEKFLKELENLAINKEELKSFWNNKCGNLLKIKEDEQYMVYNNPLENKGYEVLVSENIYVLPLEEFLDSDDNFGFSLSKKNFKAVTIKDNNLIIETYTPSAHALKVKIYDAEALNYIRNSKDKNANIDWEHIDYLGDVIQEELNILPDTFCIAIPQRDNNSIINFCIFKKDELISSKRIFGIENLTYGVISSLVKNEELLPKVKTKSKKK